MVTEMKLGDIPIDVVFKDIKNVHLSVYPPTGRVRISAPERMSMETIRLFAIAKLGWIKRQQKKLQAQEREPPREYLERESHYLWGKRYLLSIEEHNAPVGVTVDHRRITLSVRPGDAFERRRALLDDLYRAELKSAARPLITKWEKLLDQRVEQFFVQRMKTKWGSSNPVAATIRLNLDLAKRPLSCLDYVILHEIVHFVVPDHSERFAALLDHHMPHWQEVRRELNEAPLPYAEWPDEHSND
jgi:predicted metal-dependent hydrolase